MIRSVRIGPGKVEYHRDPYKANEYTVSHEDLDALRDLRGRPFDEAYAEHDGFLRSWGQHGRLTRDGREWMLLDYLEAFVEMEIKPDGTIGEVVPVPPERAWQIVLEEDRKYRPDIIHHF
jgi:hypothetical protein